MKPVDQASNQAIQDGTNDLQNTRWRDFHVLHEESRVGSDLLGNMNTVCYYVTTNALSFVCSQISECLRFFGQDDNQERSDRPQK